MKNRKANRCGIMITGAFVLACAFVSTQAQTTAQQAPTTETNPTQAGQILNPLTELNLTPDQIRQWRELNRDLRQQEIDGKARLAQARLAYAEAIDAQNPNEELIKQRAKELADAQSAMTQLQALRQARTLQILTPEQRIKLKEIRKHNQEIRDRNQALIRQQQTQGAGQQRLKRLTMPPASRKALKQQPQKQKR